jgi:hypothetical protein
MVSLPRRSSLVVLGVSAALSAAAVGVSVPSASAAAPQPFGTTWVANQGNDSLTAYSATGHLIATIRGANTGLDRPMSVAEDAARNIFATNFAANSITEYAAGSTGNVSPIRTISGAMTGLNGPAGLAVFGSQLWVTDENSDALERFTTGSTGNVLPGVTIAGAKTKLDTPTAIGLGPNVETIFALNSPVGNPPSITAYRGSQNGDTAPQQRITGTGSKLDSPGGLAVDETDLAWVANGGNNSLTAYGVGAKPVPLQTIAGAKTKLNDPDALSFDAAGNLTAANLANGSPTLVTFHALGSGNIAPTRTVTGNGLDAPTGVNVSSTLPSAPRAIHAASNHSAELNVSWTSPTTSGGGVTGYIVEVKMHGSFRPEAVVRHHRTSVTTLPLPKGHPVKVAVRAENVRGNSSLSPAVRVVPASAPGKARHVTTAASNGTLSLRWRTPKHNGGHKIGAYQVRYAPCRIGAKGCVAATVKVSGKARHVNLAVASHRTYHVLLRAKNSVGFGKPVRLTVAT